MIHSRIVGVQRTIKNSKIICELSSTLTGKPHRPTQQRNDKLALTNSANPVCSNVPWSSARKKLIHNDATQRRSIDYSRNSCRMRYFCHTELIEIT
jgi:hypothetical protein